MRAGALHHDGAPASTAPRLERGPLRGRWRPATPPGGYT